MDTGLGASVGVVDRVSRAIAAGEVALQGGSVRDEARRRLGHESPWMTEATVDAVVHRVLGFGPIQDLIEDEMVTDILVNGPDEIWADRGTGLERCEARFSSSADIVATVERAIAPLGLRIDRMSPMVAARLPDGSRLQAVLPPASVDFPLVAIRRFTQRVASLDDLVASGAATEDQAIRLRTAVSEGRTLVVSGGTGAGKTTLLNVLGEFIGDDERVVTIEDAAELSLPGHVVRLEARPANAEGAGEITIRSLLKSALRLRPDRIIVGEVRGPEALDLVWALNTGHRGSMTTVHANSPEEAIWRIETLALSAGETSESGVVRQLRAAVDVVCQIERTANGRRITDVVEMEEIGQ
ncbi:MAG: ATPase, T2SS/T4P/T4SS family [Actinomycetota bacterium]|nr:ATPase, T2SS/T4P/T4SS family [Actinomycetota bacterium]